MTAQQEWAAIGRRVREARLAAKLSQDELGRRLQLDRTVVAKIESGRRRVDAVELLGLSECLNLPFGYFLHEPPAVLSRRIELLEEETTEASRESFRLDAALANWLSDVRQVQALGLLESRPICRYPRKVDSMAAAYQAAAWLRAQLGNTKGPLPSLIAVCEEVGLLAAVVDIPGDGASVLDGDLAVAVVSSRHDPGRRRATAAHELGHSVLGDEYSNDLGVHASRADREGIIDAFAAEFLLPAAVISTRSQAFHRSTLVAITARYRTSWSLAVRQAVRAGALDASDAGCWFPQTPTRAELLDATGWTPQPDLEEVRVPPSFAHAVLAAHRRRQITSARAAELMRGQLDTTDFPSVVEEDIEP